MQQGELKGDRGIYKCHAFGTLQLCGGRDFRTSLLVKMVELRLKCQGRGRANAKRKWALITKRRSSLRYFNEYSGACNLELITDIKKLRKDCFRSWLQVPGSVWNGDCLKYCCITTCLLS